MADSPHLLTTDVQTDHGTFRVRVAYWPGTPHSRMHPGEPPEWNLDSGLVDWQDRTRADGQPASDLLGVSWADLPAPVRAALVRRLDQWVADGEADRALADAREADAEAAADCGFTRRRS